MGYSYGSVSVSYDAFNHISLEIPQNPAKEISLVLFKAPQADVTKSSTPMKYLLQVQRNACWIDLKELLSNLSGIPSVRLSVCDVYENEVCEIFDDQKSVMSVQSNDTIVAYEIDPYTTSTIHAITTHVRVSIGRKYVRFGYPLFFSFDTNHTCHDVWERMWKQVSYLFDDVQNEDVSALLRIRLVIKDGSPRDVFPRDISSNSTIETNDFSCSSSILPRYSKTRLSTYLGPECTERFLFLHLEWSDSLHNDLLTHERFLRTEDHSSAIDSLFLGRKQHLKECVTLERCFQKFTRSERLDQYNQWYCSVCKEHVRAMKTIELWNVPNILIVHFKRFEYMHALRREKIDTLVEFPRDNLDMNKFCGSAKSDDTTDYFVDHTVPAIYDLFGVVNHYGRMGFGHYLATCRRFSESNIEDDWFSFDDSIVQEIPGTSIVSSSAYVLFYRRRIFA